MSSELKKLAEQHGIERLRFFMPGNLLQLVAGLAFVTVPQPEEEVIVECRADVSNTIYDVVNSDHKIRLVPVDTAYGAETFYNVDFISLCAEAPKRYHIMVGEFEHVYFDKYGKVTEPRFKPGTVIPGELESGVWGFNYRDGEELQLGPNVQVSASLAKKAMRDFVHQKNVEALLELCNR